MSSIYLTVGGVEKLLGGIQHLTYNDVAVVLPSFPSPFYSCLYPGAPFVFLCRPRVHVRILARAKHSLADAQHLYSYISVYHQPFIPDVYIYHKYKMYFLGETEVMTLILYQANHCFRNFTHAPSTKHPRPNSLQKFSLAYQQFALSPMLRTLFPSPFLHHVNP